MRARRAVPIELALRRDQGIWLLSAAVLTLLPHLQNLPYWAIAFCATLLLWRAQRLQQGKEAPPRWLLPPLVLLIALAIRLDFGQFLGRTPGIVFLAALLCLKLLETRNMRDIRAVAFLCFFLQFGLFFSDQSIPAAASALLALLVTLGGQIALSDPASRARERLRLGVTLVAQGTPFMVILFLLFPRPLVPLWGVPDSAASLSGLSDSMSPGTISEMILSDELAFTVQFDGPRPPPIDRYWRGPVLSRFDGRAWRMAERFPEERPAYIPSGRHFSYRIMIEPHHQQWLLALDYPAGPVEGVRYSHDFQALSRHPVENRVQVQFDSFPDTPVGKGVPPRPLDRALPARGNPRARQLAAELKAETPQETVDRILAWISRGRFVYTLQPPLLDEDSIDFFLFDSRKGFCEHFAGAFVFLARAAGVPARVVTGYQGGRINLVNKEISVRQSDAHAWTEVWYAERGWVRVDPTVLVAPDRIERGLASIMETGPLFMNSEYLWMRDRWEAVSTYWNRLVVTYDGRRQRNLLESFGLDFSPGVAMGAISLASALLMAALYFWARMRRDTRDALDRVWARFSERLAPLGLARERAEGPLDYARRLALARPAQAAALTSICTRFANLRYRPPSSPAEVSELMRAINTLELEKKAPDRP